MAVEINLPKGVRPEIGSLGIYGLGKSPEQNEISPSDLQPIIKLWENIEEYFNEIAYVELVKLIEQQDFNDPKFLENQDFESPIFLEILRTMKTLNPEQVDVLWHRVTEIIDNILNKEPNTDNVHHILGIIETMQGAPDFVTDQLWTPEAKMLDKIFAARNQWEGEILFKAFDLFKVIPERFKEPIRSETQPANQAFRTDPLQVINTLSSPNLETEEAISTLFSLELIPDDQAKQIWPKAIEVIKSLQNQNRNYTSQEDIITELRIIHILKLLPEEFVISLWPKSAEAIQAIIETANSNIPRRAVLLFANMLPDAHAQIVRDRLDKNYDPAQQNNLTFDSILHLEASVGTIQEFQKDRNRTQTIKNNRSRTFIYPKEHERSFRVIPAYSFKAWTVAYLADEYWKEAGFDYIPIEPISGFLKSDKLLLVGVQTINLRGDSAHNTLSSFSPRIQYEIVEKMEKIDQVLENLGVDHGHLHDANFVLVPGKNSAGEPDPYQMPKIFVIDFDKAIYTARAKHRKNEIVQRPDSPTMKQNLGTQGHTL